jgi:YbbR domain-containing protein
MVKEVPLTVKLTPGAGADEHNTVYTITPSSITVSGDAETLNALNQIVLGTIDLSSFISTTTQTYTIAIPNNTTNLTGTTEASVSVSVNGLETMLTNVTNIQVVNNTPGYNCTIVTQSRDVTLRGSAEALSKVIPDNVHIVADLSGLGATTGTFTVPAKIYVYGDTGTVGAVGIYTVTVLITRA